MTIDFHRFIYKKLYIGDIITNVISENKSNKNNIVIIKRNWHYHPISEVNTFMEEQKPEVSLGPILERQVGQR